MDCFLSAGITLLFQVMQYLSLFNIKIKLDLTNEVYIEFLTCYGFSSWTIFI